MKKRNEEPKIKEIPSSPQSTAPLFVNVTTGYSHDEVVVLDFGFFAPSYVQDADYMEDSQVVRLCLPWSTAEALHQLLSDILKSQPGKKNKKKPRTPRS